MNKKFFFRIFYISAFVSAIISGCTGLRKLPDGELLFSGGEIKYDSAHLLSNHREAQNELYSLIKTPNSKLLWMRPFLSIYNMVGEPKKDKGIKYWLKYKLGEKPVLLSDLNLQQINAAMINRLENMGHFNARSSFTIQAKRKTAGINFLISPEAYYKIRTVHFPDDSSQLSTEIKHTQAETLLKPGAPYNLNVIKDERTRIDKYLKNNGYFYFGVNYLLFDADSTIGQRQINLDLKVSPTIPMVSGMAYTFDTIYVYDDYSLDIHNPDTVKLNNYYYISNSHFIKPKTILDAIFMHPDSLYSREDHYNTLSHLMGLDVYKFANARFTIADTLRGKMNSGIYLTPEKKLSLSAEISAAVKSNNYAGPGLKISLKNRNTFRGAELFSLNLGTRVETQYSGEYQGETSYEITLDGTLAFPRFVPFRFNRNLSRQYVPKTIINIGGGLYSRVRYYELHSFNVSLGYSWQSSKRITQQFRPIDINFTNLVKSSDEFQKYLDENPTIKRSFEEQFIIGGGYNITYSNQYLKQKRSNILISQDIQLSGNLVSLLTAASQGSLPTSDEQHLLLGVPYSQYVRLRNEIRLFFKSGKKNMFATRLISAGAFPYGNSATIPYVKQFYVGGTNSVRAFRARTVGPGTFAPSDTLDAGYLDQSGDIKIESSLEYRFPIYGYLKGALFVDAGNIWLVNKDEQRPGGVFNFDKFYNEFAVGTGFGFRLDFNFVVVRFDLAFPIRKPYLPEGERWVIDDISLGSSSWRKNNIVLNIAIGQPF